MSSETHQQTQPRPRFTEVPTPMLCPNCNAEIVTQIKYVNGALTWLACAGCCLFLYVS